VNDRAAEVQACLEPRADEMAGLLEELIARDTENPPGRRLSECGRLLSDAMARLGFAPELLEVPPIASLKDPCIVRGMAGDGTRKIPGGGGAIEHADQAAFMSAAPRPLILPSRRCGRNCARFCAGTTSKCPWK
jgi:acetylornithine deacetylase/succinyl-diaminopimelate desuccinylase-like protein